LKRIKLIGDRQDDITGELTGERLDLEALLGHHVRSVRTRTGFVGHVLPSGWVRGQVARGESCGYDRCGCRPRASGLVPTDELLGADVHLDLVRAFAYDHQRCVTIVAFDVGVGGIAVTDMDVDGVE